MYNKRYPLFRLLLPMRPSPRALLAAAHSPAFLVSQLTNIRYLTGMSLSSGLVLVVPGSFHLFVDGRYTEAAKRHVVRGVSVHDGSQLELAMTKIRTCAIEIDEVTISREALWKRKFKNTKFIHREGIVEEFRRQKSPVELRFLRKALAITDAILRRVPRALHGTITEQQLAWKMEQWARDMGAEGLSFEPIVAFGNHTSSPHHHPTARKLKKGDIVQIDVGARYQGYCGDRSEVFFTTRPIAEQRQAFDAVAQARDAAKKAVRAGASTRALDGIARDMLKKYGMADAFIHSLGHGVGLDIHEGVSLSARGPNDHLLKNEVVTIEPGVYFPGKFGIRLEDMVFVR